MRAALLLLPLLLAAPNLRWVPLLDLVPSFEKGRALRNRTERSPGIFVAKKRHRGLNAPVPCRIGWQLDGAFERMELKVGVLDGSPAGGVVFRLLGDGEPLLATPPLFPDAPPIPLNVTLKNVLLLELVTEGPAGSRAAVVDARFGALPDRDLSGLIVENAPFSPKDYPVAFRRRVNDAIDRGVASLLHLQRPDGSFQVAGPQYEEGGTALLLLACLHGGTKPDDPRIVRAFSWLRPRPFRKVYNVACLLLALEAKYFPGGADDRNAYIERPRLAKQRISEEDQEWIRKAAEWLARQQGAGFPPAQGALSPVWRYPEGGYDLSNTQYALFGLAAANRCGVPTSKVWLPALRFLLGVQEKEGPVVEVSKYQKRGEQLERRYEPAQARGFGYMTESSAYGSMTTAGLCSLILCQQALHKNDAFLGGLQERTRSAIRDALAWIQEYYDVSENVFAPREWWHYYLFNLERTGVLLDLRYFGTRDWYLEGANLLLDSQDEFGSFGTAVDSAFAILFLKRATVPAMTNPLR
jgi:hypothetical protein